MFTSTSEHEQMDLGVLRGLDEPDVEVDVSHILVKFPTGTFNMNIPSFYLNSDPLGYDELFIFIDILHCRLR